MGIDATGVSLLLAVLEKKSGGNFLMHDVYVNLAGGLQVSEPAIALGVVAALLSSQRNAPIAHDVALFGEVGLLGEVRGVAQADLGAREAAALGFRRMLVPQSNASEIRADVDVVPVRRIEEFTSALFGCARRVPSLCCGRTLRAALQAEPPFSKLTAVPVGHGNPSRSQVVGWHVWQRAGGHYPFPLRVRHAVR